MSTDGLKANIGGSVGGDDIRATNDRDGSILYGNAGDDTLRGGRYNDIITGGEGDDKMFGGDGADTFRFFGLETAATGAKPAGADEDKIFDLDFSEGDRVQFLSFGGAGENVMIESWADLADLVANTSWEASEVANGNLSLTYDFGGGISQTIVITGGWDDYQGLNNLA